MLMPVVPDYGGDDGTGGIPRELHPTQADLLMAAAMMAEQKRAQQEAELQPRVPSEALAAEEERAQLAAHMMGPVEAAPPAGPQLSAPRPPLPRPLGAARVRASLVRSK